jgi:nitrite reductase (NADH) large subunit
MNRQKIIVIGNGMVGYKFCARLLEKDRNKNYKIITFCEEPRPAYDRVHLTDYFSGISADELSLAAAGWYAENDIDLHIGDKVISIDRGKKQVTSQKGLTLAYDKLIMATGSAAFVPPLEGIDKQGVFVYRTIEDLDAITEYAQTAKTAAVIGGGLLGLEAAKAAKNLGLKTSVIEFAPYLMPRQLDETAGLTLKNTIEKQGISVKTGMITKRILGNGKVTGMEFEGKESLQVDMIIVSAGIRPRDELASACGLNTGPRGGIMVDETLKTSDPNIYAIGECALYNNMIYGLVAPGNAMADVVASQLTGKEVYFKGADMSTKLKLIGTDVASFGDIAPGNVVVREVVLNDSYKNIYKKLIISEDGKKLYGGILVGDASAYGNLLQIAQNNIVLPPQPIDLIVPKSFAEGNTAGSVMSFPDTAQICSCENVSKGVICSAIEAGNTTLGDIKKCTSAGTGCGGCAPLISQLINGKLKEAGKEVKIILCEHFPFSRVEIFEIIKATGIKSFSELLEKYGQGEAGCEICKPAVASVFASVWNTPVLNQPYLQDTNDAFLANIQRDGTYSVVPRVAGGELTPEQLIAIGSIAKEFNLYTKITGGQRIDMFGAKLHELPLIWKKLIDAGFETGQAYGKSMRTIKSCVGSTWCRFGVQDSTSLAIELENRYKGIRAPHKLKSAVSGCARECAEAQSKDFGVIATEKGWNLYVAGNGGMKPRHADLLAADLDKETLIKYIDRYLMYYIKTADKLTRTATWLQSLEGGLDHLKDVIINDSLGICTELEAQMKHLIDTYACEWKSTINDPQKLKRFNHFINSDESDPTIKVIEERGQKRPAKKEELVLLN